MNDKEYKKVEAEWLDHCRYLIKYYKQMARVYEEEVEGRKRDEP